MAESRKTAGGGGKATVSQTVDETFAQRLRQARKARGWTQAALADALHEIGVVHLSQVTIARLEKVKRKARLDELLALAVCLDVSPLYLLAPGQLETELELAPKRKVASVALLRWARGDGPLDRRNADVYNFMAPGSWVTWKPDEPETIQHGSGLTPEEAQDLVSEFTLHDREKERSDA